MKIEGKERRFPTLELGIVNGGVAQQSALLIRGGSP
jgi:hypothetical protein